MVPSSDSASELLARSAALVLGHAHVQGAVLPKAEASLGQVELHRAHAQIEQGSVDDVDSELVEHGPGLREVAPKKAAALPEGRQARGGQIDGQLILIEGDHRRPGRREREGVTAGTGGPIQHDLPGRGLEQARPPAREEPARAARVQTDARSCAPPT